MSDTPSKPKAARKHWDTTENVFKTRSNSSWVYEKFTDREVTMVDIFAAVQKYSLDDEQFTKSKKSKGNKLFATYIYRAMVEEKIYDGNAAYYSKAKGYKQPTKAWAPVDKAIKEYNKHEMIKGTDKVIKLTGAMKDFTASKGATLSPQQRMDKFLKELSEKNKAKK